MRRKAAEKSLGAIALEVERLQAELARTEELRPQLVGLVGIAKLLGVPHSTVKVWRSRGQMPEPYQLVDDSMPVWFLADLEEWLEEKRRVAA